MPQCNNVKKKKRVENIHLAYLHRIQGEFYYIVNDAGLPVFLLYRVFHNNL
jgi:hypothetical protein